MSGEEVIAAFVLLAATVALLLAPWVCVWVINRMEARYVRQSRLARLAREQRQEQLAALLQKQGIVKDLANGKECK